MKKIIFVAGPPGAGKTEFIKSFHLDMFKVFDLDNYRNEDIVLSNMKPISYSEKTKEYAGRMMNDEIDNSLLDDTTIVIEATFSSLDNTLEKIKNNKNYQIYIYLFVVNEIEFFISTLERYMYCYSNNLNCRMISFEKYLNKVKFYKQYINVINNYDIKLYSITRNGSVLDIHDNYFDSTIKNGLNDYSDRISTIRNFCYQNNTEDLLRELEECLVYYDNYDKIR